ADDARAARLMRVLVEVAATGHQVIVLTCHRATVDTLQGEDAAWFDANVVAIDFDRAGAARPA
ncbi:MAG: hypothetical protein ABIP29_02550, partial [Candidatus Eisenbacteria bacterium]